jgi:hypothetical protein
MLPVQSEAEIEGKLLEVLAEPEKTLAQAV